MNMTLYVDKPYKLYKLTILYYNLVQRLVDMNHKSGGIIMFNSVLGLILLPFQTPKRLCFG